MGENKDKNSSKKKFPKSIKCIFYPDRCAICGKVIVADSDVCNKCKEEVTAIQSPKCRFCGKASKDCKCRKRKNFYEELSSVFVYSGKVKSGLLRWKYQDFQDSVSFFAKAIAATVNRDFSGIKFDFITFVPQTETEQAERGYNHCEILSQNVGIFLKIDSMPLLTKIFETQRQHDLPLHRRSGNVFGVFDCKEPGKVEGKTILLVDDIRTSGCTLNECAKILHLNGAAAVYCAVIAVA